MQAGIQVSAGLDVCTLCTTDEYADAEIVLLPSQTHLRVHRIILSRLSHYFASVFRTRAAAHAPAVLQLSCPPGTEAYVPLVLRYLYGSALSLTAANAVPILVLSDMFLIPSLQSQALTFLTTAVSRSFATLVEVMINAVELRVDLVLDVCYHSVLNHVWHEATQAPFDLLARLPAHCLGTIVLLQLSSIARRFGVRDAAASGFRTDVGAATAVVAASLTHALSHAAGSGGDESALLRTRADLGNLLRTSLASVHEPAASALTRTSMNDMIHNNAPPPGGQLWLASAMFAIDRVQAAAGSAASRALGAEGGSGDDMPYASSTDPHTSAAYLLRKDVSRLLSRYCQGHAARVVSALTAARGEGDESPQLLARDILVNAILPVLDRCASMPLLQGRTLWLLTDIICSLRVNMEAAPPSAHADVLRSLLQQARALCVAATAACFTSATIRSRMRGVLLMRHHVLASASAGSTSRRSSASDGALVASPSASLETQRLLHTETAASSEDSSDDERRLPSTSRQHEHQREVIAFVVDVLGADELRVTSEDDVVRHVMDVLCEFWWDAGATPAAARDAQRMLSAYMWKQVRWEHVSPSIMRAAVMATQRMRDNESGVAEIGINEGMLTDAFNRHSLGRLIKTPAAAIAYGLRPPRVAYALAQRLLLPSPAQSTHPTSPVVLPQQTAVREAPETVAADAPPADDGMQSVSFGAHTVRFLEYVPVVPLLQDRVASPPRVAAKPSGSPAVDEDAHTLSAYLAGASRTTIEKLRRIHERRRQRAGSALTDNAYDDRERHETSARASAAAPALFTPMWSSALASHADVEPVPMLLDDFTPARTTEERGGAAFDVAGALEAPDVFAWAFTDVPIPVHAQATRQRLCSRARMIHAAYLDVFNHISVKRGWRSLPFTPADMDAPLRVAAEVAAVLREWLDVRNPGFTLRQLDGAAREYLWSVPMRPAPHDAAAGREWDLLVLRGVAHATMQDARGYVEGMTASRVDACLQLHPFANESQAQAQAAVSAAGAAV